MRSLITQAVARVLIPLFLFFSFYMLFRGHNEAGGGFIGGLIGTIVFVLYGMIYGADKVRELMPFDPIRLIFVGLMLIVFSGMFSFFVGDPYMSAIWFKYYLPFFGKLGTPILFDIGVYLLVMGMVLKIAFTMLDE